MTSNSLPAVGRFTRPPVIRRQRCKGRPDRAYCTIDGKRVMLGVYGSPDAVKRFAQLIGGNDCPKPTPTNEPTVAVVMAAYLEHAKVYYRQPHGKPGREYEMIRDTLRFVKKNCSALPARDFGPKRLKQIRDAMVETDHSRKYINKNIERVRRMFRWAAAEELVPVSVHTAFEIHRAT